LELAFSSSEVLFIHSERPFSGSELWDIEKGKSLRTFSGHTETIYFVDFSPDNKLALSGSYDGTIKIWDLISGKLVKSISGKPSHFISGGFSKNGQYIILAASDSTLRLYNLKTSREEVRMIGFSNGEWVNITTEGFFNCSNKGSQYITVSDNSDTYPMEGIYYDTFYRPEVIAGKIKKVFWEGK
jgi:WD40 repeat protein